MFWENFDTSVWDTALSYWGKYSSSPCDVKETAPLRTAVEPHKWWASHIQEYSSNEAFPYYPNFCFWDRYLKWFEAAEAAANLKYLNS